MNTNNEIDVVLNGIFNDKYQQISEGKSPKYAIISKPVEAILKIMITRHFPDLTEEEIDKQTEIFGLKIIPLDRDDLFYLVG